MSQEISVGDKVRIVSLPSYLKTAEPMPMLRPADVLAIGEEGVVIDRRPGGYWGVRFTQGAFLVESKYIEVVFEHLENSEDEDASSSHQQQ